MKKIFGVLIAAFLLCLAGCDPNVSTDTSAIHIGSYAELKATEYSNSSLGSTLDTLDANGYFVNAVSGSEYSSIGNSIRSQANSVEISENRIKSIARSFGASGDEVSAIVAALQSSGHVCIAKKTSDNKVKVYLF